MIVSENMKLLAWPAKNDLNPYVELTYCSFRVPKATVSNFRFSAWKQPADVFHIHWPEAIFWGNSRMPFISLFRAFRILASAKQVQRDGGILALTLHNLAPHQGLTRWQQFVWRIYQRRLFAQVNLVVSLSQDALAMCRQAYPPLASVPSVVVPHPHYRSYYSTRLTKEAARKLLNLPEGQKILGVIGSMRPSKLIPETIYAFRRMARHDEILYVAGSCDKTHWEDINSAAGGDKRVRLHLGTLSDDLLAASVTACDVILLNQAEMLNSGTALLSLSFDRPLISVAAGSMVELANSIGEDWVKLFDKPLTPEKLRKALDATSNAKLGDLAPLDQLDPWALSDLLYQAFLEQMSKRPG